MTTLTTMDELANLKTTVETTDNLDYDEEENWSDSSNNDLLNISDIEEEDLIDLNENFKNMEDLIDLNIIDENSNLMNINDTDMTISFSDGNIPSLLKVKDDSKFEPDISHPEGFTEESYKQQNLNNTIQQVIETVERRGIDVEELKQLNENRDLIDNDQEILDSSTELRSGLYPRSPMTNELIQIKKIETKLNKLVQRVDSIQSQPQEQTISCHTHTFSQSFIFIYATFITGLITGFIITTFINY